MLFVLTNHVHVKSQHVGADKVLCVQAGVQRNRSGAWSPARGAHDGTDSNGDMLGHC